MSILYLCGAAVGLLVTVVAPLLIYNFDLKVDRLDRDLWRCWLRNLEDTPVCAPLELVLTPRTSSQEQCTIEARSPHELQGGWNDRRTAYTIRADLLEPGEVWIVDVHGTHISDLVAVLQPDSSGAAGGFLPRLAVRRLIACLGGSGNSTMPTSLPGRWPVTLATCGALITYWAVLLLPGPSGAVSLAPVGWRDLTLSLGIVGVALVYYTTARRDLPPRVLDPGEAPRLP